MMECFLEKEKSCGISTQQLSLGQRDILEKPKNNSSKRISKAEHKILGDIEIMSFTKAISFICADKVDVF